PCRRPTVIHRDRTPATAGGSTDLYEKRSRTVSLRYATLQPLEGLARRDGTALSVGSGSNHRGSSGDVPDPDRSGADVVRRDRRRGPRRGAGPCRRRGAGDGDRGGVGRAAGGAGGRGAGAVRGAVPGSKFPDR